MYSSLSSPAVKRQPLSQSPSGFSRYRYEMVSGMFSHELGHVLYTDFLLYQSYHSFMESGKWFPEPPVLRNITERDAEADLWDFQAADPKNRQLLTRVTHDILNVLEDGYIENRMLLDYPGILGSTLETLRQVRFEQFSTMEDMIDQEEDGGHIWLSIRNGILSYMLWGELKYGGTPLSDERIQMVFSLLGDLDICVAAILPPMPPILWELPAIPTTCTADLTCFTRISRNVLSSSSGILRTGTSSSIQM